MVHEPDFHVVSLQYFVADIEGISYDSPPPLDFDADVAQFRLADGELTCNMKQHYATAAEARAAVEPILRSWELDAHLRAGRLVLRFEFNGATVVDRAPPPGGGAHAYGHLIGLSAKITGSALVTHVARRAYPPPPQDFRTTPDVETLYIRYRQYQEGTAQLLAMAYFCLTVVEAATGPGTRNRRSSAAAKFQIDLAVLEKLGELTSERGDPATARKMKAAEMRPLSGAESIWIEEAIKQIIWRLGDLRPVALLPKITMADLPTL